MKEEGGRRREGERELREGFGVGMREEKRTWLKLMLSSSKNDFISRSQRTKASVIALDISY